MNNQKFSPRPLPSPLGCPSEGEAERP